jgi:maltose alpha-D-glucosyltransferase/alpha-amylase
MRDLWYKDAIIYCLDVETYQDVDTDGIGNFQGLTQRLDHLAGLGVNCLWLLPFYPTPNRDNGYDILDYYDVDPRLGTLGDFVEFMHGARERGIRVIADLVVNHTSDQHPWFQEARDPDSDKHDWYVWSEEKPEDGAQAIIYEGDEPQSPWTYDQKAKKYYFHRFYDHQPDLNIANPEVRAEIRRIMGFWLELGISGFRLDAAPYLIELRGIEDQAKVSVPYEYLREFRDFLQWRQGNAILLAEANVSPDRVSEYFGNGTRMHMIFNFILNQKLFLALARQEADPLEDGLRASPDLPNAAQWANFLRNHDELTLDKLSDDEREEVFEAFAPEENMQIFGRGIRRRLAPMMGGDERRLRMAYSLMFSLPGTPVLRYGEEIGMGDNLSLEGRKSVRTAMQWSTEHNGGFSNADPEDLARPVIKDGLYGYERRNVADQRRDPDSRLNWMERLIRVRKEHHEFGWGDWSILETEHPALFAHACQYEDNTVITVHNLTDEAATVRLDLSGFPDGHLADILADHQYEPLEGEAYQVDLDPYGYRWFHLVH